jgi:hypothetical protein
MKHTKIPAYIIVAAAIIISSTSVGTRSVSAATSITSSKNQSFSVRGHRENHGNGSSDSETADESSLRGIIGTISIINGNTISILSGTITYTVDASSSKIIDPSSAGATSTFSIANLKIGDVVAVRGTVSGTSIAATSIFDGKFPGKDGIFKHGPSGKNNPAAIKARHYQGVVGIVSAINGSTLTVDGKQATSTATSTYTVDASTAKILKSSIKGKAALSDIVVGDTVRISGDVTGTAIKAKVILDGQPRMHPGSHGLQFGKSHRKNG